MKIPFSLLRQCIHLSKSHEEVAHALISLGIEVDAVTNIPQARGCITAHIKEVISHPDANSLRIATVNTGDADVQVICGASNCEKGMIVAFAPIGSIICDNSTPPLTLKKAKLRGIESFGMLLGEKEIGLIETVDGIISMPKDTPIGIDITPLLSKNAVFEVSLTPNLGHCFSALGIARELSAYFNTPFHAPEINSESVNFEITNPHKFSISVASEHCQEYIAVKLKDVNNAHSPKWLKHAVILTGKEPSNLIEDTLHYVLMLFGIPLYAFGGDAFASSINVALSDGNDTWEETGKSPLPLTTSDTIIVSKTETTSRVLSIAGIVSCETIKDNDVQDIWLHAGIFSQEAIARTSRRLKIRSDASSRNEKGIDPNLLTTALNAAISVLIHYSEQATVYYADYVRRGIPSKKEIICNHSYIERILGMSVPKESVLDFLNRGCFRVDTSDDEYKVTPPTWRNDINYDIDIVEEIGRLHGYDSLTTDIPNIPNIVKEPSQELLHIKKIKKTLLDCGLSEWVTCNLSNIPQFTKYMHKDIENYECISMMKAKSIDQSVLRPLIMPTLLDSLEKNITNGQSDICVFEIGTIHSIKEGIHTESLSLCIAMTGNKESKHFSKQDTVIDFYDIKGVVEKLLLTLYGHRPQIKKDDLHKRLHPGITGTIYCEKNIVGTIGRIHPITEKEMNARSPIFVAEIDVSKLTQFKLHTHSMTPLPKYPGSSRDMTLQVAKETTIDDIISKISNLKPQFLEKIDVIDTFRKPLEDVSNITIRLFYRSPLGTLENEKIDTIQNNIIKVMEKWTQRQLLKAEKD